MKSRDDKPPRQWNSTLPRRTKGIERTPLTGPVGPTRKPKPRKPVKKVNAKRKASEFERCYGSHERVAFVQAQRCITCGPLQATRCVNAHIKGDGMSRKADFTQIVPLCFTCHGYQHFVGAQTFARMVFASTGRTMEQHAAQTQAEWDVFCRASRSSRT